MKIIETNNFKRLIQAQEGQPPAPPPPPPKRKKKRKFKDVTDDPMNFDNSSVAQEKNNLINPVPRVTEQGHKHKHKQSPKMVGPILR